jgi:excisionase family DNA binding protein
VSVSPETARLALTALGVVARQAAPRRNGLPVPALLLAAIAELEAVIRAGDPAVSASGREVPVPAPPVAELISVGEAARRLRVSERTVRRRAHAGRLPARRLDGRTLAIEWRSHGADVADRVRAGGAA